MSRRLAPETLPAAWLDECACPDGDSGVLGRRGAGEMFVDARAGSQTRGATWRNSQHLDDLVDDVLHLSPSNTGRMALVIARHNDV